jgi:NAD(P)-dependent dehydrogenase (short-subunit alcohol dehydrogenase family)
MGKERSVDVAVIIGVGGMGSAIARRISAGKKVVIADFNDDALRAHNAAFQADGHHVLAVRVDVSSKESVDELARTAAALGPVRQVVHTAGVSPVQASIEAILKVDLLGTAMVLDAFGPIVADGGSGLVIASMAAHLLPPLPADEVELLASTATQELLRLPFLQPDRFFGSAHAYGVAKRANIARVAAKSKAWGQRGATLNTVSPGIISTAMGREELDGENGAQMQGMITASGAARLGTPDDIAEAAAFLLGPTARFITGADLLVDGGVVGAFTTGALAVQF